MKKKCPNCNLVNYASAENCLRCEFKLLEVSTFETPAGHGKSFKVTILRRVAVFLFAVFFSFFGFYLSLVGSAEGLEYDRKNAVERSILLLDEKGFSREVFLLRYVAVYRATDNWLNASMREDSAYAATNFPFEIITVYDDFSTYPKDDTERAAIILHEAQHLKGADEKQAYAFVWKNRKQLGWTKESYGYSIVWRNVRKQTREIAPELFVCEANEYADCTE